MVELEKREIYLFLLLNLHFYRAYSTLCIEFARHNSPPCCPAPSSISDALQHGRVVALLGPRQVGKTTLARLIESEGSANYFDLEDPATLAQMQTPKLVLERRSGIVVLDEVQRLPELFPLLRVLADRVPLPAKFLVLGSATPDLLRQSAESLAGRIEYIDIPTLNLQEVDPDNMAEHWVRGGYPLSYLAADDAHSLRWRRSHLRTVVERDLPQLGIGVPAATMMRFWGMLAHVHAQLWNSSDLARSMGVSDVTVRRYLDHLSGMFLVRQLQPYFVNLGKRLTRAPKVYIRDSGLLHALLSIQDFEQLERHAGVGASWEGYVIEELIKAHQPDEVYFYRTQHGAELDLLMKKNGRLHGFEVKRSDAPTKTASMRVALQDLGLERLVVVYPGQRAYHLAAEIEVLPLRDAIRPGLV